MLLLGLGIRGFLTLLAHFPQIVGIVVEVILFLSAKVAKEAAEEAQRQAEEKAIREARSMLCMSCVTSGIVICLTATHSGV